MSSVPGTDTNSRTSQPRSSTDAFSALSSEEFMKIIFTELTNQDPLAPNQTKDLLQQVSTIRSIESDLSLTDKLDDLVKQNQIASSSSLVGKFIAGRSDTGAKVAGLVGSVTVTDDGAILNLGNNIKVPLDQVEQIIDPDLVPDDPADEPADEEEGA
jgi:flagellar basal-body rod modification protein FlgD